MTATTRDALLAQLVLHEGYRAKPYMDSVGKITIGVGRNLSDVGLSDGEVRTLLANDVDAMIADLATFPWFLTLDPVRQRVIADMRFNLGPTRFRGFQRVIKAMARQDYQTAAVSMRESMWFRQVKSRGVRLVKMMQTGAEVP